MLANSLFARESITIIDLKSRIISCRFYIESKESLLVVNTNEDAYVEEDAYDACV